MGKRRIAVVLSVVAMLFSTACVGLRIYLDKNKGDFIMLERIETREIMTAWEATIKYPTKYFFMVITEIIDRGDNDLGYVIYTADTRKELSGASLHEYKGMRVASMLGGQAEPYPCIGNVVHHG